MIQVNIDEAGNLRFTFKEVDDDSAVIYKLLNAGEVEFVNDECVGLELLDFERQLNRGKINDVSLVDAQLYNDDFVFNIDVDGQTINGKVSMASLKDKI